MTATTGPGQAARGADLVDLAASDAAATSESERREVSAGAHFRALDGYRAMAALMVVMTHIATTTGLSSTNSVGHVLARFDFGVPLFFLMSGFLLYRPWARAAFDGRPRPALRRYAVRRAARILPLYWVVVLATFLVLPEARSAPPSTWLIHLAGLQIYIGPGIVQGLSQTWSLCTEIAFYVALPLFGLWGLGRRSRTPQQMWRRQIVMIVVLALVAVVYNTVASANGVLPFRQGVWLPAYLDWFGAGMLLALVEVRSRQPNPPALARTIRTAAMDRWACLAVFVAVFAVASTPIAGSYDFGQTSPWESMFKHELYLVAAAALLAPGILAADKGWPSFFARTWPRRTGLISYGIFLWHLLFIRLLLGWLDIPVFSGHALELLVCTLPITLAVATVTYVAVERPPQRWAHRR